MVLMLKCIAIAGSQWVDIIYEDSQHGCSVQHLGGKGRGVEGCAGIGDGVGRGDGGNGDGGLRVQVFPLLLAKNSRYTSIHD
jgi:hypothetical protein